MAPEATDTAARPPRRRQRRHRMSSSTVSSRQRRFSTGKLAELILIFTSCFATIFPFYFFALQNNDVVQNQNINADKIIDLPHVLQESSFQRNNSNSVSPKLEFCGHNKWKGKKGVSCDDRVSFLVKKYNVPEQQAKTDLLEQPQQQCRCECPHFLTRREKTIPTPPQAAKTKKKRTLVIIMGNLRGT